MNFFNKLLNKHNLTHHDGRSLWEYEISNQEFEELRTAIKFSNPYNIKSREVALYYAIWWKRNYNGGAPSKKKVFDSIGGNLKYDIDEHEFYRVAKNGAEMLGVKWIRKQNTLYFKTLLLQGGLPLKHISENKGAYKSFLEAVLEEQPETVEDFILKPEIINILPKSSQNEIVYENCFQIVKAILNDDERYNFLLNSEPVLKEISNSLKIKKRSLREKERSYKPRNYWLLKKSAEGSKVSLRIGLNDHYTKEGLGNILGVEIEENDYQFFIEDRLICVFRKMLNEKFKTDWYSKEKEDWNFIDGVPYTYFISHGEKTEVKDFIPAPPLLDEPSLWVKFESEEWRFVRGNAAANREAAILFPDKFFTSKLTQSLKIMEDNLNWLEFEGEESLISNDSESYTFKTGVNSFDWYIENKKPWWMIRSNIPVTDGKPKIQLYDGDNKSISKNRYRVFIKRRRSDDNWEEISMLKNIRPGYYLLKIVKDGIIAYDSFFNLGSFRPEFQNQSIYKSEIRFKNFEFFEVKLYETEVVNIEQTTNQFSLSLNTSLKKMPKVVKGSIGFPGKKKLKFDLVSPFQGLAIVDGEGNLVDSKARISISNLHGLRVLNSPNSKTQLILRNSLKPEVSITKTITENIQPLISFKDEILRLFYLANPMNYENTVLLELNESNDKVSYQISGFSHYIDEIKEESREIILSNFETNLDLFAIPINILCEDMDILPLHKNELTFQIPEFENGNEFIIVSSNQSDAKLMPRYVNAGFKFQFMLQDKKERIKDFHEELEVSRWDDEIWKASLEYFNKCIQYDIPFSTFDQISAVSRSSKVAARAFFYFGLNSYDLEEFIQRIIPEMEKDLGFCFHWIFKNDWVNAIEESITRYGQQYAQKITDYLMSYLVQNNLQELFLFIASGKKPSQNILQTDILELRSKLGERVLRELPKKSPYTTKQYGISIEDHKKVRLLIQSPMAIAESIIGIEGDYSIWGDDETTAIIRRNIQYAHYLTPNFYVKVLKHVLSKN